VGASPGVVHAGGGLEALLEGVLAVASPHHQLRLGLAPSVESAGDLQDQEQSYQAVDRLHQAVVLEQQD
jgi:hypothetical protein